MSNIVNELNETNLNDITNKRNCPSCNKILNYKNQRAFQNATNTNKKCQTCSRYGRVEERKIFHLSRSCPRCKKELTYSSLIGCYNANRNQSVCGSCRSSLQMQNKTTRRKRIRSLKSVKHTWHKKIASNRKKNGTYVVTEDVREKHRINKVNRMIEDGTLIWPNYNREACHIFHRLEKDLGWDGLYATKGKEQRIGRFWVDYYEPTKNIVIEYDEPHHYNNGELCDKDKYRQKWIEERINCKFFRINENTRYEQLKNLLLNNSIN